MDARYSRNRIYVKPDEQELIKNSSILLAGSGIGSVIAECALRFGFENLTIIDGDQVEKSNLNRQNYIEADINIDKVAALKKRLLSINEKANINVHNCFLTKENLSEHINNHKIAINALDFNTEVPLFFDEICQQNNIPVLHPYNLGWGGLVTIISPNGLSLRSIAKAGEQFNELRVVEYITSYMKFWGTPQLWIDEVLNEYLNEKEKLSPPQLSIGSWMVASMCTHILFKIITNKEFKTFPEFYFSSINNDY
ncbi:ThiF family adenylyltransferase [Tenacibaculum aiptasiae]|uniref:ThiF family adenylyltransferase n=1 Tax=Tenacibaculum aiptasiae TaxID=426481 RepID=A0A7J5A7V3_9FLAO|nr:ThiF family adenylyltransferase [Tenacibaculum aiptasiae]KAB1153650.1 ThiF family adenylyltransferase [Tenacibaculum aiptasiae]